MYKSLQSMKRIIIENKIEKVAMPLIGCGLDGLKWGRIRVMIKYIFENVSVEIVICRLNNLVSLLKINYKFRGVN